MDILLIYCAGSCLLLFSGYLVTVFSNAIYIDPDEIKTIFPQLSDKRRRQLEKLISDPRTFFRIGTIVRISSAMLLGLAGYLMAVQLSIIVTFPLWIILTLIMIILWSCSILCFIYFPRMVTPQTAKHKMIRFLPLINLIYIFLTPVMKLMTKIPAAHSSEEISEEDKDDIVERAIETLAESAGISGPIIEEDEKEMIHQIFQLDVTEVVEIMTPRMDIAAINNDATIEEIRDKVKSLGFSRYPVISEEVDNIIGILYVKDLLALNDSQLKRLDLKSSLREPLRVPENRKIDQLLAEFKKSKTHVAIVMDEFGGTAGLVTLEDILEEIVGEIEDEHDPDKEEDIVVLPDGTLEISGFCPLENVAEKLGITINTEEFETIGGMIYDLIGTVPTEGTSLNWKSNKIRVLRVDGQRIIKVLITPGANDSQ